MFFQNLYTLKENTHRLRVLSATTFVSLMARAGQPTVISALTPPRGKPEIIYSILTRMYVV